MIDSAILVSDTTLPALFWYTAEPVRSSGFAAMAGKYRFFLSQLSGYRIISVQTYGPAQKEGNMLSVYTVTPTSLEREAARAFYAIPGVEEVRMESDEDGVVFWIRANNLSEDDVEALVAAEISLHHKFPKRAVLTEIKDRFDREILRNAHLERLPIVSRSYDFAATT